MRKISFIFSTSRLKIYRKWAKKRNGKRSYGHGFALRQNCCSEDGWRAAGIMYDTNTSTQKVRERGAIVKHNISQRLSALAMRKKIYLKDKRRLKILNNNDIVLVNSTGLLFFFIFPFSLTRIVYFGYV